MTPLGHDRAARTTHFERRRPLFWLALAFATGILLDHLIAPRLSQLGGACAAAIAGLALLWAFRRESFHGRAALPLAAALSLCAGAAVHGFGSRVPPPHDISRRTSALPSFVFLEGVIVDARRARHEHDRPEWTFALARLGVSREELSAASGRVVLKAPPGVDAEEFGEGDLLSLCARVEAPPDLLLPGGFDLGTYLKQQGVRRVGEVLPETLAPLGRARWRLDLTLRRWSSALAYQVESLLPQDDAGRSRAALLNALLFGRRERVSFDDRESFAIAGTAHLLAISGLQT